MQLLDFRLICVVSLAGIAGAMMSVAAPADEEASAIGAKWLSLLDNQKYEENWNQAASLFRDQVNKEQWLVALKRSREPMGPVLSRTSSRVDFVKTLQGAPDGDYAIIHFTTSFKNKAGVTERLTLVKEDGKWQAAAYAIH
jgi:Protein of unknown function (DUF4019)